MRIRFLDTEKNVTYLEVHDNYTWEELLDMCKEYYENNGELEVIDEMAFIDWCIVHQYMTLLSDEASNEIEENIKNEKKSKKKKSNPNNNEQ